MSRRLLLLPLALLLPLTTNAKDKKKNQMPELILRAQTVRVVIDPYVGEPVDQPAANAMARDNVEKALTEWGRYKVVMDGAESDLVIAIHTGDDRMARPTIKGGPIDQRAGVGQSTDSSIRIGGQRGQSPINDPSMDPQYPQNQGLTSATKLVPKQTPSWCIRDALGVEIRSTHRPYGGTKRKIASIRRR